MNRATQSQDFSQTRWSIVRRLQGASATDAQQAAAHLAVRYWYPVYAYVRRCGHGQEIAQDITQAFLHQASVELREGRTTPDGRFRHWLLERLTVFLASDWAELTGGDSLAGAPSVAELEARNRAEHEPGESAETAFQRGFALEVLSRGLKRLRDEANQTGRLDMCEALEPFLVRDPLPGQYDEVSRKLGTRPLALVVALRRLRQRYRELVQEELADVVSSPEELEVEQRMLIQALEDGR